MDVGFSSAPSEAVEFQDDRAFEIVDLTEGMAASGDSWHLEDAGGRFQALCCVESPGASFLPLRKDFRSSFSSLLRYDQPTIDRKMAPTERLIRARERPSR